MAHPAKRPKGRFTYGDSCTWPEDERWELIDGEAFDMSAAPLRQHAELSRALFRILDGFFNNQPCEVYYAPFDVRLPEGDEADEDVDDVVQPDISVVCDPRKLDRRGCRGAPDLVVEILSPSTAARDCILKRRLYERHGVREYWIVDPENRLVTQYVLCADGEYGKPAIFGDTDTLPAALFPELKIDLADVFPPVPQVVRESPREYRV